MTLHNNRLQSFCDSHLFGRQTVLAKYVPSFLVASSNYYGSYMAFNSPEKEGFQKATNHAKLKAAQGLGISQIIISVWTSEWQEEEERDNASACHSGGYMSSQLSAEQLSKVQAKDDNAATIQ